MKIKAIRIFDCLYSRGRQVLNKKDLANNFNNGILCFLRYDVGRLGVLIHEIFQWVPSNHQTHAKYSPSKNLYE